MILRRPKAGSGPGSEGSSLLLPIPFLHFSYQFVRGELPSDHHDEVFNHIFCTIHIQQSSNDDRQAARVHLSDSETVCDI